ncbi:transmembrane protein 192-like [Stylophora pistillata]|uniref:Transmembrane protein 192 n=1 Tax=Stylophora pistillata TaxID=50429 RepID=A0A2B4S8Z4_STYPI|nr:transmembrane protein 192-like [Stylophora pistillata]PFX25270.1 Transmembrane protein 192 [Stylophora pistillata]
MVSLSGDRGSGGYFFNREDSASPVIPSQAQEEALANDTASLGLLPETKFHPIRTAWIAILQLILFISFESLQFIFPNKKLMGESLSLGGTDPPFSFLILLHVGLWVIIFICDRVLQFQHHQSQAKGYLEFFRETKELRRIPHSVLSLGNAVLLVLYAVIGHDSKESDRGGLALYNILQITFTIEFIISVPGILWYIVKVFKFNARQPLPDAEDSDFFNVYTNNGVSSLSTTGYRDNDYLDEVLEKQADMIRYLQQHNTNLGKRLMKLTAQQGRGSLEA